jgi:hypothetical protein
MSEQLTLEKARRNRSAVDRDKSALASVAQPVDGARNQFFAGAGFAKNEHSGVRPGYDTRVVEHSLHRCTIPENLAEFFR